MRIEKDVDTDDVTSLESTPVYWVGEGTCDTNDSLGNLSSIIYIATSFGEVFDGFTTPDTHYICAACISGFGGQIIGLKPIFVSGNRDDESAIFLKANEIDGLNLNHIYILGTNSNNRCG